MEFVDCIKAVNCAKTDSELCQFVSQAIKAKDFTLACQLKDIAAKASEKIGAASRVEIRNLLVSAAETIQDRNSINRERKGFRLRVATRDDLEDLNKLESESYPEDEAASRSSLAYRLEEAQDFFIKLVEVQHDKEEIVGFVCSTLSSDSSLTHDSMSTHCNDGSLLCVHSVVISKNHRRQGLATYMMDIYLLYVSTCNPKVRRSALLAKEHLVPFYEARGYKNNGPSRVVHGQETWYDLDMDFS